MTKDAIVENHQRAAKKAQSDADAVMVLRQQLENEIANRLHREKLSGALVNDLRTKLDKAVKCLEFYGDSKNWTCATAGCVYTDHEKYDWELANECLEELGGE